MYRVWMALLVGFLALGIESTGSAADRPNIVWIFVDDMSANFSCYGETQVATPNVDRLAREGTRFTHAYVTAPVCSACRSALITGMYQTSLGAHHHRSGRGDQRIALPAGVIPVPKLFQQAGYYTCIGAGIAGNRRLGKTDYNFEWEKAIYDGPDWAGRKPGQPFFMQVQLHGGKYREGKNWEETAKAALGTLTDPASVELPPYYPRDEVLRHDWARYLDACRYTDWQVGQVLERLEAEKILDQTLVIFMTDHGISHARGKQFLYDEGTHVPLVIRGPGIGRGVRDDLVEHIDLPAISLAAAGIAIPPTMQGRNVFGKEYQPRPEIFAARDRCDETTERIRSVRTDRWLYIRNFHPDRPMLQPNAYKDNKPILLRLRELHAAGKLDDLQERLLFAPTRPAEELYEWQTDRYQLRNLAGEPEHLAVLEKLRARLDRWMGETNDHGRTPESAAAYDAEMAAYLSNVKGERRAELERNIAQMKAWEAAGK